MWSCYTIIVGSLAVSFAHEAVIAWREMFFSGLPEFRPAAQHQ